jgi:hypothetical protein
MARRRPAIREVTRRQFARLRRWSMRKPCMALMGEFSAGKSTLLNFLIEENLLPTQATATELPPVWFSQGNSGSYWVDNHGGQHPLDLANFVAVPKDARYIRLFIMAEILEHCDVIDTPGISDPNLAVDSWRMIGGQANMVLWCSSSTQAWRESERSAWVSLPDRLKKHSILVITRADKLVTQSDREKVARRIARETAGLFRDTVFMATPEAVAAKATLGDAETSPEWEGSGAAALLDRMAASFEGIYQDRADMFARYDCPGAPGAEENAELRADIARRKAEAEAAAKAAVQVVPQTKAPQPPQEPAEPAAPAGPAIRPNRPVGSGARRLRPGVPPQAGEAAPAPMAAAPVPTAPPASPAPQPEDAPQGLLRRTVPVFEPDPDVVSATPAAPAPPPVPAPEAPPAPPVSGGQSWLARAANKGRERAEPMQEPTVGSNLLRRIAPPAALDAGGEDAASETGADDRALDAALDEPMAAEPEAAWPAENEPAPVEFAEAAPEIETAPDSGPIAAEPETGPELPNEAPEPAMPVFAEPEPAVEEAPALAAVPEAAEAPAPEEIPAAASADRGAPARGDDSFMSAILADVAADAAARADAARAEASAAPAPEAASAASAIWRAIAAKAPENPSGAEIVAMIGEFIDSYFGPALARPYRNGHDAPVDAPPEAAVREEPAPQAPEHPALGPLRPNDGTKKPWRRLA